MLLRKEINDERLPAMTTPPAPHSNFLGRLTQGLMVLLVLAVLCFVLGKAAAAMLDEKIRITLTEAGTRFGVAIRAEKISFVSLHGVTIDGLAVALPEAAPFLSIESVRIRVHPLDWLIGRPYVSGADLVHPQLTLRRDAEGIWELSRIKRAQREGEAARASALRDRLDLAMANVEIGVVTPLENVARIHQRLDLSYIRSVGRLEARLIDGDEALMIDLMRKPELRCRLELTNWSPALIAPMVGRIIDLAAARISAEGEAVRLETGAIEARFRGRAENLTVEHPLLSRDRADGVGFGFEIDLYGLDRTWLLRRGAIELGGETVSLAGTVAAAPEGGRILNLRVGFDRLDLGRVVAGIPRSLTPRLPDLAATGRIDGVFGFSLETRRPASLDYSFQGTVESFAITSLGPDLDLAALHKPFTHVVTLPNGETKAIRLDPANPSFVSYGRIPSALVSAILMAEDGSFFIHKGFSPRHIHDALIANLQAGRVVRGASTITMQLAKNLFLSRERTLSRKFEEAFLTFALEQEVPKKRMMEIYLNIIEWGPGIYGIGPAARYYFDSSVSDLKPLQCAFLASIIARPNKGWGRDPLERIGDGWRSYLHLLLTKMHKRGDVTLEELVEAGVPEEKIRALMVQEEPPAPWMPM
jgi:hypothetical protein